MRNNHPAQLKRKYIKDKLQKTCLYSKLKTVGISRNKPITFGSLELRQSPLMFLTLSAMVKAQEYPL